MASLIGFSSSTYAAWSPHIRIYVPIGVLYRVHDVTSVGRHHRLRGNGTTVVIINCREHMSTPESMVMGVGCLSERVPKFEADVVRQKESTYG